jgi:predicted naringenin-chalcone synthase
MTRRAFLNRIGTAVPDYDVHEHYARFAATALGDSRERRAFERLLRRGAIEHRYAVLPFEDGLEQQSLRALYFEGPMPDTAARMRLYERHAFALAERAIVALGTDTVGGVTHLILTSCTGFSAPGVDLQLIARFGLDPGIERTVVGFMGCAAALNALKLARHIVRSDARARVLVVDLELCTLHLQRPIDIEQALGFALFADGCAASLVTAEPTGLELHAFASALIPESANAITWHIGALGFDMHLSLEVPRTIALALSRDPRAILDGVDPSEVGCWAVHPGGRAVLDAVENAFALPNDALHASREVLRRYGNMSSASVVFVLAALLERSASGPGRALAFGPGMTCESMSFSIVGAP